MKRLFIAVLALFVLLSCTDSRFLETVPDKALVIPETLEDYQAILDNVRYMNGNRSYGVTPTLGEAASDDYTFRDEQGWKDRYLVGEVRNIYTWNAQIFEGEEINEDWANSYRTVFYANSVLTGLDKLNGNSSSDPAQYNSIKGSALFFRAHAFYQLAQIFAPPYPVDSADSASLLGIPLRLNSDINEKIERSNLKETYQQIQNDLLQSISLLPKVVSYNTRPSKPAAYALMARVCMVMHRYDQALFYADSCLQLRSQLLDYNSLAPESGSSYPFADYQSNPEILFFCRMGVRDIRLVTTSHAVIVDDIYNSYDISDLRKSLYFSSLDWGNVFKGNYTGYYLPFTGLATDEVYLMRAECLAREGQVSAAMNDLNTLLEKRWVTGKFIPFTADTQEETLQLILKERRKELLMRGLRWVDLRRFNQEGANIHLWREVDRQTYHLPPNDPRYTYPIPSQVIRFNPGMPQNLR